MMVIFWARQVFLMDKCNGCLFHNLIFVTLLNRLHLQKTNLFIKENVVWFQTTMDEALRMQIFQAPQYVMSKLRNCTRSG